MQKGKGALGTSKHYLAGKGGKNRNGPSALNKYLVGRDHNAEQSEKEAIKQAHRRLQGFKQANEWFHKHHERG